MVKAKYQDKVNDFTVFPQCFLKMPKFHKIEIWQFLSSNSTNISGSFGDQPKVIQLVGDLPSSIPTHTAHRLIKNIEPVSINIR